MRSEQHRVASFEWLPAWGVGWELFGEGRVHGRLTPGERAWVAELREQAWTIQRVGFHRPRVVVRPVGVLAEVAHLEADWRGLHGLHFASGPSWEIDPTHSGGTVVRDEAGREIVRLAWNGRFEASGARVHADGALVDGRFGAVTLAVAGYLFLSSLGDPRRRLAVGVPIGSTARTKFS